MGKQAFIHCQIKPGSKKSIFSLFASDCGQPELIRKLCICVQMFVLCIHMFVLCSHKEKATFVSHGSRR